MYEFLFLVGDEFVYILFLFFLKWTWTNVMSSAAISRPFAFERGKVERRWVIKQIMPSLGSFRALTNAL